MVRWLRWHCPPDTGFEIRALAVWGRARYLSVTEAPHNTNFHTWMVKKQFCFFQTAETGNRTPDSGVKGSGANHYPRAPALQCGNTGNYICCQDGSTLFWPETSCAKSFWLSIGCGYLVIAFARQGMLCDRGPHHVGGGLLYSFYPWKSTLFNMPVTESHLVPKVRKMPITF